MAERRLKKLNRRELLQMLLVQCEESERLQQELDEIKEQFNTMSESYERLKEKLNVKDERLNQKDEMITAVKEENGKLAAEIDELKRTGAAGPAAEAVEQIGNIFREAQKAAEQYLADVQKGTACTDSSLPKVLLELPEKNVKMPPLEQRGKESGFRKERPVYRTEQTAPLDLGQVKFTVRTGNARLVHEQDKTERASFDLAAGSLYG